MLFLDTALFDDGRHFSILINIKSYRIRIKELILCNQCRQVYVLLRTIDQSQNNLLCSRVIIEVDCDFLHLCINRNLRTVLFCDRNDSGRFLKGHVCNKGSHFCFRGFCGIKSDYTIINNANSCVHFVKIAFIKRCFITRVILPINSTMRFIHDPHSPFPLQASSVPALP